MDLKSQQFFYGSIIEKYLIREIAKIEGISKSAATCLAIRNEWLARGLEIPTLQYVIDSFINGDDNE